MKIKRIIITGKGGSGKDYLRKIMEGFGFTYCKSYTTRPIREGEENGKDYFFIEDKDIPKKKDLYESVYFNDWFYGTPKEEFEKSNLFIMTPKGVSSLKKGDRKNSIVVYVDSDEDSRRSRLLERKDADDVERRIDADEEDFKDFNDFDITINNSNKSESDSQEDIVSFIENLFKK
jgi:guanylate kinase